MMHKDMDRAVNEAFTKATPNVLSSVLSECSEQKGTVIVMTEKRKISWGQTLATVAAVLALIICVGAITGTHYANNAAVSTISLDVNPSIELVVDMDEDVLEVKALNADAQAIISGLNLKGADLDDAVETLVRSMLQKGYISELSNSILISVDSKNAQRAAALQAKLTAEVSSLLNTETFSGAVISQTVTAKTELEQKAEQYGISLGKAQLVEIIAAQDSHLTFGELASLSINELNLLTQRTPEPLPDVDIQGVPSEKKYIGTGAARDIAAQHANVTPLDYTVELDYENGHMVYEVELFYENTVYEYEIDATTGAIVSSAGQQTISPTNALQIVLDILKIQESDITDLDVDLDTLQGAPVFEISFKHSGFEYEYTLDTAGNILMSQAEPDDDYKAPTSSTTLPTTDSTLGPMAQDEALSIALSHARLTKDQITHLEIELDTDDGKAYYDISFRSGVYEYDYEVDSQFGIVLKAEKEKDDDSPTSSTTAVTREAAIATALKNLGVAQSQVTELEAELETENGKSFYEVSFKTGGWEYDYEIEATTGNILNSYKEKDD